MGVLKCVPVTTTALADASIVERVRYVLDHEIAPQLAAHGGRVTLEEIDADGVVVLRFGGGCHGCGMVDVTLRDDAKVLALLQGEGLKHKPVVLVANKLDTVQRRADLLLVGFPRNGVVRMDVIEVKLREDLPPAARGHSPG